MATQRKSNTSAASGGKRTASGGKRTTSGGNRAASQGKKISAGGRGGSRSRRSAAQEPRPFRREVCGVICLLLAIFCVFDCFHMDAVFIRFFCGSLKGLIGYGFWATPFALLLSAYILLFHRGRPVRLRLLSSLLLPGVVSCLAHGILVRPEPWSTALVKALWESGAELQSGGAVCGTLAQGCVTLFTIPGCTIIFTLAGFFLALAAFNRTVVDLADWMFDRPKYEPEPEPEHKPERERRVQKPKEAGLQTEKDPKLVSLSSGIDIPVDDGPLVHEAQEPVIFEKKKSFFNRIPKVPSPDQLLREQNNAAQPTAPAEHETTVESGESYGETPELILHKPEPAVQRSTVPEPEPVPIRPIQPNPTPVPRSEPAPPVQIVSEPPVPSESAVPAPVLKENDPQQAAAQIAQDIQEGMNHQVGSYQYPPLSLLSEGSGDLGGAALVELSANRQRLEDTIHSFGIDASIIHVTRGPSVTRYELELDQGVRLNKLTNLSDDIALALGASGVRIAPIPDQIAMVGIEVPNKLVSPVSIHSVIGSKEFTDSSSKVSFAVGRDIGGNAVVGNIAKMPHLLIAGTTGSGKSVCTNSLIISLLYKATPEEVRLIMVDPKMVELGIYNGIPHLLIPVVTDPKKAAGALQWAVSEMMKRYRAFSELGVRDLASYNMKAARTEGMEKMPQVVVIIDELADLMLVAAKEVEESICRVAQMGRASGMHLIIATQRPSADVITGLMKANIPSRIAFAVASSLESRIILDITGAEKLVGRGDMLYFPLGSGKPTRVQGCLITDQEVASVVDFIKQSGTAQYDDAVMQEIEQNAAEKEKGAKGVGGAAPEDADNEYDELIDAAAEVVIETGQASVSMLQRRLKLGYARAARLVDQLEERGIVGPFEGSKPRQLLITKEQWQELKFRRGTAVGEKAGVTEPKLLPENEDAAPPSDWNVQTEQSEEGAL